MIQLLVLFTVLVTVTPRRLVTVAPRWCGGEVRHVHLAVGRDPSTEMTVSFASIPSKYSPPIGGVLVGTSPEEMEKTVYMEDATASSFNLTVEAKKANYGDTYFSPYYHHVTISGLEPSTVYYYKPIVHTHLKSFNKYNLRQSTNMINEEEMIKALQETSPEHAEEEMEEEEFIRHRGLEKLYPYDGSEKGCPSPDKVRTFRTAPAPATKGDDSTLPAVNFAIMGDLGQFPHSQETLSRMLRSRDEIDAIVLAGDIAYSHVDNRQWDTFFDFMDDYSMAENKPLMIVPGNHDIDKHADSQAIFLDYEHRFRMPRVHPAELGVYAGEPGLLNMDQPPYPLPYEWGNAYYAYTYGPARFVMISAYSAMEPNSTQYKWIVEELSSVDRSVTPWLIIVLHTPLYNTFSLHLHDPQIIAAKEHLEPLFVKYQANMVFTGHIHAYLRTKPVMLGKVDPKGPIHITVGAGGRKCEAPFYSPEPEEWVGVRDATIYGYGMFRIFNRTHAQWDWVHTGHADDHSVNAVYHSNQTLPAGPAVDRITIENQYYI